MDNEPAAEKLDLKQKIKVRGGHKGAFTRLESRLDTLVNIGISNEDQLCEAEVVLSNMKTKALDIHRWNLEIQLETEDDAKFDAEVENATEFNIRSGIAIARLTALIENYKKRLETSDSTPLRRSSSPRSAGSKLRLPKLNLPTFSGSYTEWMSFFDLFRAAVDSNTQLTDSEKLNYLRACLKGDAAKLICSVSITDANYAIAMGLLTDRYANKRSIVQAHLQSIWSQPSMKVESASGLRKLLEVTNEHLRSLNELGQPTDQWDSLLVFWLSEKMDPESRKQWQLAHPGTELLTWNQLAEFLNTRSRALESSNSKPIPQQANNQNARERHSHVYTASVSCVDGCNEEHKLHECLKFKTLSVPERFRIVKAKRGCYNCLQIGHNVSKCPSKFTCRECRQRHHTMLHRPSQTKTTCVEVENTSQETQATSIVETVSNNQCAAVSPKKTVLLSTAYVTIKDADGTPMTLRAMLDSGSQASFINESRANAMKSKIHGNTISITPFGSSSSQKSKGVLSTVLNEAVHVDLHIVPKISNLVPPQKVKVPTLESLKNLKLADPHFNSPGRIDILLGADVLEDVMKERKLKENGLHIRNSIFGWIISGPVQQGNEITKGDIVHVNKVDITQFWELENVPEKKMLTKSESECVEHFNRTTKRKDDGRFVVEMPLKSDGPTLGSSKAIAMRRFLNLEKKLNSDLSLKERYAAFIQEFLDLGHLERVPDDQLDNPINFYLPHHCVTKEESSTTKLRVVFDASAKTSTGFSLNDCLLVGPKCQDDLFNILIRFRIFKIGMSADVAKMYRQVELSLEDRDLHRILWRKNPNEPILTYRMTRVTYGVASSSFHAIRSLLDCAKSPKTPEIVKDAIERDFYVDDILTGAENLEEAKNLQTGLIDTLKQGQFDLRKWTCSDARLTQGLPPEYREASEDFQFLNENHTIKTLGIVWSPIKDKFTFTVTHLKLDLTERLSKRRILSDIAKVFDPLGWLSPVTLQLKQLMQEVWKCGTDWDAILPSDISEFYCKWRSKLKFLNEIAIDRFALCNEQNDEINLHLFCDASEKGYAACVYIVSCDTEGNMKATLLTGKSKVSPLKTQSIPRLELCAALLGVNLLDAVVKSLSKLKMEIQSKNAWTDSTIVLSWLLKEPSQWSTFVANRISKIHEYPDVTWRHVPSEDNAADAASRGIDPHTLKEHSLWWSGPQWLVTNKFPEQPPFCETKEELKRADHKVKPNNSDQVVLTVTEAKSTEVIFDLTKENSFEKALRIVSTVKRAFSRLKREGKNFPEYITFDERTEALCILLRQEQGLFYKNEISTLKTKNQVDKSSKILKLYPFLHEDVLCVGGRLVHANLPDEAKYQRIIPPESQLARLIIANAHEKTLHGGTNQVLAQIRTRFWIPASRAKIRKFVRNCVKCSRFTTKATLPLMGDLPKSRIDVPTKAFQDVGIDFGGPFACKGTRKNSEKAYLALFVCFASRAVHLEAVSDLTTQACIAALRRFTARRGCPVMIYTDNGSNFAGTKAEIEALQKILKNEHANSFQAEAANLHMKWNLIPPRAPHFGGLWEASIKSAKHHLRRIMGNNVLSFEELTTLFCQIEWVLNSRPIGVLSDDPKDPKHLTPAHLCCGGSLEAFPMKISSVPDEIKKCSPQKRWFFLQNLLGIFWKRWTKEHVSSLQERLKWKNESENLRVGDLVYLTDDNVAPLQWPLGRITYVYSGPDQFVRVVKVKTSNGIFNRPVAKLRKLPLLNDNLE